MVDLLVAEQEAEILALRQQLADMTAHRDRTTRMLQQKHADLVSVWNFCRAAGRLTDEHIAVHTNVPVPTTLERA